ncbi:lysoplasmalogenase [Nocardiopsis sp. CNT-189]|uniref:lysoplasmalogenase n=1 Tax=Nocardiopsis oceanisediminis TaxID=2816862 RepID=UPI003B31ADB6
MVPRRPLARALLAAFLLLAAVHLAVLLLGAGAWDRPTQVLLMPALALAVLAAAERPRSRPVALLAAALFFSWLGDALPALASGDTAFLLMVGGFLAAQLVYVLLFWPYRDRSVLLRRRWLLAPYAGAVAALVWLCAPHAGGLLVPVLAYGAVLGLMAVLATGAGPWTAAGGALFLASDGLIALRAFVPGFAPPLDGFWVMASYCAAQALIALGALKRAEAPPAGAAGGARARRRGGPPGVSRRARGRGAAPGGASAGGPRPGR